MRIITKGEFAPKVVEGYLYISVEIDPQKEAELDAKKLVRYADTKINPYGEDAGIRKWGGPFVVEMDTKKKKVKKQAVQFQLTKPLQTIGIGLSHFGMH